MLLQVVIAESYGGKDEPVDTLTGSFVDISVESLIDPLRVKATPTEATYQVILNSTLNPTICLCSV